MKLHLLTGAALLLALSAPSFAQDGSSEAAPATRQGVDPLAAEIRLDDLERFAAIFLASEDAPDAAQLQAGYLDPGSYGVEVFTPHRIVDTANLAAAVAAKPEAYRKALDACLPEVRKANADLRSIYLGLQGALPEARLPEVYVLMGAGNSGGTAGPGAQVLGLEVICALAGEGEELPTNLRRSLRHFFAHETVHVLQYDAAGERGTDYLLQSVLAEGAADFIARLVTGEEPDPARARWGEEREDALIAQLATDMDIVRNATEATRPAAQAAMRRWVHNYGSTFDDGRPGELGYWMGMRIWEAYYATSIDKRAALQRMLTIENPREILAIARSEVGAREE